MRPTFFFSVMASLLMISCGVSQENETAIPSLDPKVRYGKLENGFTYYIRNFQELTQNDKPGIKVKLLLPGERFEDEDQLGLAHLIEHIQAYTRTTNFNDFLEYRESTFKDYRRDYSVTTDMWQIEFNWGFPGNDIEGLKQNLQRLRELAWDNLILEHLKDSVLVDVLGRRSVLEEAAVRYDNLNTHKKYKILNSPRGHRSLDPEMVIHKHNENIKNFTTKSLLRFYEDWFRPDKQCLIIVGSLDVDEVEQQIRDIFSDLKMPENPREKSMKDFIRNNRVSLPGLSQVITLVDSNRTNEDIELELYFKRSVDKPRNNIKEEYREQLLEQFYNSMMYSRMQSIQNQQEVSYKRLSFSPWMAGERLGVKGNRVSWVVNDTSNITASLKQVITELERVRRYGFTQTEFERAKETVLYEIKNNVRSRNWLSTHYNHHFLFGTPAPGPEYVEQLVKDLVTDIAIEEIHACAQGWLEVSDRDLVFTIPQSVNKNILPKKEDFDGWMFGVKSDDITPYIEPEESNHINLKQLFTEEKLTDLSINTSYSQTEIKEIGVTQLELDNGLQVFLKPIKEEKGATIYLRGFTPKGTSHYNDNENVVAEKAAEIVQNLGVGGWSKSELAGYTNSKGLNISLMIKEDFSHINASATVENLECMFQLLYLYMTEPNKNKEAFTNWVIQEKTESERKNNDNLSFYKLLEIYRDGVENKAVEPSDIGQIRLDQVHEIYKEIFSDANNMTFFIAGTFEVDEIKPLLLRYLGNLPSKSMDNSSGCCMEKQTHFYKEGIYKTFYSKNEDYYISVNYGGNYTYNAKTNLQLDIIKEMLDKPLWRKGVDAGLYWSMYIRSHYDNNYYRFEASPSIRSIEGINTTISVMQGEIAKIKDQGPDPDDFALAKASVKERLVKYLEDPDPRSWANYLWNQYKNKGDLTAIKQQLDLLESITEEDIQNAVNKYFALERQSVFKMLPEKEKLNN